jgi:hypothetical protein
MIVGKRGLVQNDGIESCSRPETFDSHIVVEKGQAHSVQIDIDAEEREVLNEVLVTGRCENDVVPIPRTQKSLGIAKPVRRDEDRPRDLQGEIVDEIQAPSLLLSREGEG